MSYEQGYKHGFVDALRSITAVKCDKCGEYMSADPHDFSFTQMFTLGEVEIWECPNGHKKRIRRRPNPTGERD